MATRVSQARCRITIYPKLTSLIYSARDSLYRLVCSHNKRMDYKRYMYHALSLCSLLLHALYFLCLFLRCIFLLLSMRKDSPVQQPPDQQPPYQYGQYIPPQSYPPPIQPKKKHWPWGWIIALIVVFFLGRTSVITSDTPPTDANTSTVSAPASNLTQSQPTTAPTKPPKPLGWTTTQSFSGNGEKKTGVFTVPADWKVNWTCDPASFGNSSYNLSVTVMGSDNSTIDLAVNTLCATGNVSGSTEEHQAGQVFLDVSSEAAWTITIQEMK